MSDLQFKTHGQDRRAHDGARTGSWQLQSGHGRVRFTGMCAAQQQRKAPPDFGGMKRACTKYCRLWPHGPGADGPQDVRGHRQFRETGAKPGPAGKTGLALRSDAWTREAEALCSSSGRAEGARCRVSSICCPLQYACEDFASKIEANRAHASQQWIFNLIRGDFSSNEVVFLDEPEWLLVQGSSHASQDMRYLVIFKDTALHTIRDLRQGHLPLLRDVRTKVSRFVARRHATAQTFRQYFHYMPSVFQLHMHVCCNATVDMNRTQDVRCVMRNLQAVDTWYRDALILFSAPRAARAVAPVSARCGGDKREGVRI